ncbi:MAG: hypothetical protein HKN35_01560 [Woeseia sp.]|nr:hypothetical protein [Woeseia sp.]
MTDESNDAVKLALDFVEALTQREYDVAFAMTSADFVEDGGNPLSLNALREQFEMIVPTDWVFVDMEAIYAANPPPEHLRAKHIRGPLAIMEAETDWVDDPDVAFMYVSIADNVEGEGLSVFVTRDLTGLKIREITFGRP